MTERPITGVIVRSPQEILATGAAWITESELSALVNEIRRLEKGSEIPALRAMVEAQATTIARLRMALTRIVDAEFGDDMFYEARIARDALDPENDR